MNFSRQACVPVLLAGLLLPLALTPRPASAGQAAQPEARQNGKYDQTDWPVVAKRGREFRETLKPDQLAKISDPPVIVEPAPEPSVMLQDAGRAGNAWPFVSISTGYVDLVNRFSHAAAIGKLDKGYYRRYLESWAAHPEATTVPPLPQIENPRYWSNRILDEQQTNFGDLVGMSIGVNMAHHYLGHFEKYKARLQRPDGTRVPINEVITIPEFELALKMGVHTSLEHAYGVEGVVGLYEALQKGKVRPAWSILFVPPGFDLGKGIRDLEKQRKLFYGK